MFSSSKLSWSAVVLLAAIPLASCSSEIDNKPAAQVKDAVPSNVQARLEEKTAAAKEIPLDLAGSKLEFVGAKLTGDHRGSFKDYTGSLFLNPDGSVAKMQIEVQTASLQVEPEKLLGHLKSADFFDVEKFPSARFVMDQFKAEKSEGGSHRVSGELDLHGVRKRIEFPANVELGDRDVNASAQFTINRKDFGIVYPGKPDDLIKDDVLLEVKLHFPRS